VIVQPMPRRRCRSRRTATSGGSWRSLPWQTYRVTEGPDGGLAAAIADELAACRQRGIERLDVHSHNQAPVQAPVLQRLASEYTAVREVGARGRIPQLKYLCRDAIKAFAVENETDARLVGDLLFGDSLDRVTKSAGELLDIARKRSGYSSEASFRLARQQAFAGLAHFIPGFVEEAKRGNATSTANEATQAGNVTVLPQLRTNSSDTVPDPEVQRHEATTGYIDNGQHFIRLLAEASNATIIGFTNEKLASMLRVALDRKRAALGRPDACWDSLRIVFLSDKLLDLVNDERGEFPDPAEALKERRRAAVQGRRTVSVFLRSLPAARWATYESRYLPPLVGTLFELPNGQRVVQLLIRRPRRSDQDHLYLQLEDTRGHYFSAAFEEIVHSSENDNKIIPVGFPHAEGFRAVSTRYRQNVLRDGSRGTGWLPLVLVITWRMRHGRAEPLLQLRTQVNAARELDRLSHLSGHILQDDLQPPASEFGLDDAGPRNAARRRVQMETGEEDSGDLLPLGTHKYILPDKENLFFFIYGCRFPAGFQIPPDAEMYPVPLPELTAIRQNQVLRMAVQLCEQPPMRDKARADAFEIVSLNLTLHGQAGLARRLAEAGTQRSGGAGRLVAEIRQLEEQTRQTWPGLAEAVVKGLPGLQFREFFTFLVPYYSTIGVPGAAEYLRLIGADESKRLAVARLSELYRDETIIEAIPLEL